MMSPAARFETLEARRLFAFGDLDSSFNTDGVAADAGVSSLDATAVLSDGRIVAAGRASNEGARSLRLYSANGTLDLSFSDDGVEPLEDGAEVQAIFADNNGALVITRMFDSEGEVYVLAVTRYTTAGVVDPNYGTAGTTVINTLNDRNDNNAFARGPDGALYLADTAAIDSAGSFDNYSGEIRKLKADGEVDTAFGTDGVVQLAGTLAGTARIADAITSIAVASDGSLRLTGQRTTYTVEPDPDTGPGFYDVIRTAAEVFVAKLSATTGALGAFGTGGSYVVPLPAKLLQMNTRALVATLPGNKALLTYQIDGRAQFIEISAAGGGSGTTRTTGPRDFATVRELQVLPDGRPVLIGDAPQVGTGAAILTKVGATWQSGNVVGLGTAGTENSQTAILDFGITSDNKIVAVGTTRTDTNLDGAIDTRDANFQLTRLTTGTAGEARPDELANAQQNSAAFDSDGNYTVAWYDAATKNLKAKRRDAAGRWGAVETVDGNAFAGIYLSLAVAPNGQVGVAYFDGTNGDLKYAVRDETNHNWSARTVRSAGSLGLYPSLKFSSDGRPYIAFYNKSAGDLQLAYSNPADGGATFVTESIDSAGDTGRSASLNINPYRGTFEVAYAGADNALRFAERGKKGKGWVTQTIAATTGGVGAVSLDYETIGAYSTPTSPVPVPTVIGYYDAGPADLAVARRPAAGGLFSAKALAGPGAVGLFPQVLNVDFSADDTGHAVFAWDRNNDRVFSGFDRKLSTGSNATRIDADTYVTGGGKFLSLAVTELNHYRTLSYLDTASGKLFVRDV